MRMFLAAVVGIVALAGLYKGAAWDRSQAEARARMDLDGMRGEVGKALKEGQPLTILKEAPLLWMTTFADMPHPGGNSTRLVASRAPGDTGYWAFDQDSQRVYIDCTHTDSQGAVWTTY